MSLSCGHTLCRGCIVRMSTKQCPSCRVPFTSGGGFPVPNYTIRDIMTAAAAAHEVRCMILPYWVSDIPVEKTFTVGRRIMAPQVCDVCLQGICDRNGVR